MDIFFCLRLVNKLAYCELDQRAARLMRWSPAGAARTPRRLRARSFLLFAGERRSCVRVCRWFSSLSFLTINTQFAINIFKGKYEYINVITFVNMRSIYKPIYYVNDVIMKKNKRFQQNIFLIEVRGQGIIPNRRNVLVGTVIQYIRNFEKNWKWFSFKIRFHALNLRG